MDYPFEKMIGGMFLKKDRFFNKTLCNFVVIFFKKQICFSTRYLLVVVVVVVLVVLVVVVLVVLVLLLLLLARGSCSSGSWCEKFGTPQGQTFY